MKPDPGHRRVIEVNDRVDRVTEGIAALSSRVLDLAAERSDRALEELLAELSTAVEALGASTEEVSTLSEALEQAQEQLDAHAARYLELFELAPDGYLVTDANGVILESNRAATGLLGSPARFLYRKPVIVFVDAAQRRFVLNHLHDALTVSANRVVSFEARFTPPNGRAFPAWVHLAASRSYGGDTVHVRWLIRDETTRVAAERALVESEARYRLIADSSSDVVLTTDGSGRIDYASPSTLVVLCCPPPDLVGRRVEDLVHPEDQDMLCRLQDAVASEQRVVAGICRVRRGEDRFLAMEAAVAPLLEADSSITGLRYALRDVSDREASRRAMQDALSLERRAAAALREADATKDALILAASHDLNTPVAAVAALAQLLQGHPGLPPGEIAHIAGGLVTTSGQLRGILSNLLDAERLGGGHVMVKSEPTDLTEIVATRARDLGLDVGRLTLPHETVIADVDAGLMARIVDNLVSNAVNHSPSDSSVQVDIAVGPRDVVLSVADTGPGVPDNMKAEVFRAFERGPGTSAGLGLGLFIVRRFAEIQGGVAWVEDTPGGGATFRVSLPHQAGGPAGS
ncbi:MAG TPA: ATP-binding protein [Acidimicrobiales bacterium]|nr:ATP-binding protein [Acidimicrobiales bacterium]